MSEQKAFGVAAGRPRRLGRARLLGISSALLDWFRENARDLPWRRTSDPYAIWVSEIMLQQTQVKTVIPYFERWMKALPTVSALAKAPAGRIHKLWEGLGYYTRVRNMQKAARVICSQQGGKFPQEHDKVLALPGIGRYTAGAICSIAFNQPTAILDGNVIRVLTRYFGVETNPREPATNEALWDLAGRLVLAANSSSSYTLACSHFNQSMMELGAVVCTPRNPACAVCPLGRGCVAKKLKRIHLIPAAPRRSATTQRHFAAVVAHCRGRFLVRQRPQGVVNAHLWEFPNVEIEEGDLAEKGARKLLNGSAGELEPLMKVTHSITRYRMHLHAFRCEIARLSALGPGGKWLPLRCLDALAFTSAHKRILKALR